MTFPRNFARSASILVFGAAIGFLGSSEAARSAEGCAAGTRCLGVDKNGKPVPDPAPFIAQCTGTFPDFIAPSKYLKGPYKGPWFLLAQNYPETAPADNYPWLKIGFDKVDDYLYALENYAFDGMIDADFRPEANKVRPWFHMPLMNNGPGAREPIRGLTEERSITGPELGVKPGTTIHNYAVGFYNAAGSTPVARTWKTSVPDISAVQFPEGSMAFKILFSAATAADFADPSADPMTGAPEFKIMTASGVKTVRLLQMDVAATDKRSPTGWVFGTFAFQKQATDTVPWRRLRPVGMSWGNDPGYTPANQAAGEPLKESAISPQIPVFAKNHLGWAGRPNGPVDNPASGCLSCHGTAEFPVAAPLGPFSTKCSTDALKSYWFRDFPGSQTFGAVDANCKPTPPAAPLKTLDFSLQLKVSVQSVLQYGAVNSCTPPAPAAVAAAAAVRANPYSNAPRVGR
jgi:hypothetical protein